MDQLDYGMPLYNLLYVVGIVFFAYFYTAIIFNPDDVAENMRKYGGFIPGIRPGKRTAEYIDTILARVTLVGAMYLAMRGAAAGVPGQRVQGRRLIPFVGERLDAMHAVSGSRKGMNVQFASAARRCSSSWAWRWTPCSRSSRSSSCGTTTGS